MKRLYELPKNQNIKLYFDDKIVIFGHLDGLYSYCWLAEDKDVIIHINANTLFEKHKDGYRFIEEAK